ncbi:MAG: hypothetical protein ACYST0_14050 [Planctomycetota bacterium]|jgi:hypothetical protein
MHEGRFPARYVSGGARSAQRSAAGPQLLDDLAITASSQTRRAWLLGLGAFLCTSAVAAVTVMGNRKPANAKGTAEPNAGPKAGPKADPPQRGTLAWALALDDASDEQLVLASGDLEMVSARHRSEVGLVPVFERLLDITLRQDLEHADVAGACAVRSLARLGYPQLALRRQAATDGRDRPETRTALDSVLRQFGYHHKRPRRIK